MPICLNVIELEKDFSNLHYLVIYTTSDPDCIGGAF